MPRDGRWEMGGSMERPGALSMRRVRRQYTIVRGCGGWRWMASGRLAPASCLSREDSCLLWRLHVCKLWTFTAHVPMFEGKAV